MTPAPELVARLRRLSLLGLAAGLAGGAVAAFGYANFRERFYPAYLTAYIYWLGISLGCVALALVHGMTGGAWGRTIRRVVEAGYETLPLLALLFVPVWFGVTHIYPWADPEFVSHHAVLQRKVWYLNVAGFQLRAVVYVAIWIAMIVALNLFSPNDETHADSPRSLRLQRVSGVGFIAYGFTFTLAATDWLMSLEPEWYSTMYGLTLIAGQGVAGLAFSLVIILTLQKFAPWSRLVTAERLNDLGNLLLAAVMFWAYVSFFQFLIIWWGNLPEENVWYLRRSQGGWQYLALGLVTLHFGVPFMLLLSRRMKRQAQDLGSISAGLLVLHYVDLYWIIVPGFPREHSDTPRIAFHWLDLALLAAIGGLWLAVFAWRLSVRAGLPLHDPEVPEVHHE